MKNHERVAAFLESIAAAGPPEVLAHSFPHGLSMLLGLVERCGSPIEIRLAVHLWSQVAYSTCCDLVPQFPVGNYRLDFAVVTSESEPDAPEIKLAIECDGHNFHERTKEQAARDKKRDRYLVAEGWRVLRFTGSELWNEPARCAIEVMDVVGSLGGVL